MQYAREDTHYLMYIFKMMANELIEQGMNKPQKLAGVFMNSCLTCQKVSVAECFFEFRDGFGNSINGLPIRYVIPTA